jgi:hypothetical protein
VPERACVPGRMAEVSTDLSRLRGTDVHGEAGVGASEEGWDGAELPLLVLVQLSAGISQDPQRVPGIDVAQPRPGGGHEGASARGCRFRGGAWGRPGVLGYGVSSVWGVNGKATRSAVS